MPENSQTSSPVEISALWHLLVGDDSILALLEPEDFHEPMRRKLFAAARQIKADGQEPNALTINHRLAQDRQYDQNGGFLMLDGILSSWAYFGSPRQTAKILKELRARRESQGFTPGDDPALIPQEFIDKGRQIQSLLDYEAAPMRTLADELTREPETVPTGYPKLDRLLGGGIERGAVFVIAARPGMGKTTMGVNIASRAVLDGRRVLFLTMEMERAKIAERALCCTWEETPERVRKHAGDMLRLPGELIIDDRSKKLSAVLAAMSKNADSDLIVIDYFSLIQLPGSREGKQFQLEEISGAIKGMAMEIKKPVVLLAQLNREIERDKRPREPELSDLRGSGALEQDADVVTFLYDPSAKADNEFDDAVRHFDSDAAKDMKWIMRKNRNGRCGTVDLKFRQSILRFDEA